MFNYILLGHAYILNYVGLLLDHATLIFTYWHVFKTHQIHSLGLLRRCLSKNGAKIKLLILTKESDKVS